MEPSAVSTRRTRTGGGTGGSPWTERRVMSFPGSLKGARAGETGESRTHARAQKRNRFLKLLMSPSQIRGHFTHFLTKITTSGHATNARAHTGTHTGARAHRHTPEKVKKQTGVMIK